MADLNVADQLKQLQKMADSNGKIFCMDGDTPVTVPLSALLAQIAVLAKQNGGLSADVLGQVDSLNMLGQVQSFDDLRKLKPAVDGMRVSLRGWNAGIRSGGGEFIGRLNAKAADDGGTVASSGQNWYWTRVIEDPSKIDVTHFGAISDGKTDTLPAVTAMFKWSQANYPQISVRYPAGNFFLSQFKIDKQVNYFRVAGQQANFGYFSTTNLVSNTDENFVFDIVARRTELSGINFNGGNKTVANTKGFFNNRAVEGQYIRIHCMLWSYVGGTCVQMVDCLDTHIDQWYASQCTGDVIAATWSNTPKGNWDHVTAIELSNFNAQYCTKGKVLNLPRATQSFIKNGWIEHCDNPGDISNGQWTIGGFSLEDCKTPLNAAYSRLIETQRNLQSGSSISYADDPNIKRWLSLWERGRVDIQNHGVYVDGTLDVMAYASRCKFNNNSAAPQWFCLGAFFSPDTGDSIDINMVGCGNNLTVGDKLDKLDDVRQGGGNTLIRVHLTKSGANLSHTPCGSSPLLAVKYVRNGNNSVKVYIQLKPYTYNIIPLVTMNGKTHFEAGVSLYWLPDLSAIADTDMAKLTDVADSKENWSMGQKAGVGASDDGYLLLKSKLADGNLQVRIEGNLYNIAVTKVPTVVKS